MDHDPEPDTLDRNTSEDQRKGNIMGTQRKLTKTYRGLYLLAFAGFTVLFLVVGLTMFRSFREFAMEDIHEEAVRTARSYSYTITKNMKAREVVDELISHKILAAGNALVDDAGIETKALKNLASELKVDSIDVYDEQGVVINSVYPSNLGWSVYEGHPVYDFFMGGENALVGGLRVDTISDKEFQYGYFRRDQGGFIQIGVSADQIYAYSEDFELITAFDEIKRENSALHLSFLDRSNRIIASSESEKVGSIVTDPSIQSIIEGGEDDGLTIKEGDEEIYQVFVPIYREGVKVGTLSVGENTAVAKNLMRKLFFIWFGAMIFVYGICILLITSAYRRNKELIQLAYFDQKTGLPNQSYLKSMLLEKKQGQEEKKSALLIVHNSQYPVNQFMGGSEYEGKLVRDMGKIIPKLAKFDVKVFALSEDKFMIYVEGYEGKQELVDFAEEVVRISKHCFNVRGSVEYLNVKLGITEIHGKDITLEQLIKEASVSLSSLAANDKKDYAFFSLHTGRKLQMEEIIEEELRDVIEDDTNNSFHQVYQPIVSLKDASIVSFESLSRLVSKKYGEVPPVKFIEIAEKRNLVVALGNVIFTKACRYAKKLLSKGYGHIRVSVNISAIQILHDDFIDDVLSIMKKEGVTGSSIILEITESVLMENYEIVNQKLKKLRTYGIKIALDNFGTYYLSLLRLKTLNADILKIDKSFIDPIKPGDTSGFITKDVISLAHRIGFTVVAEGVELESQVDYLYHSGCDLIQGFICSEAVEEQEANLLLITNPHKSWPEVAKRKPHHVNHLEEKDSKNIDDAEGMQVI